MRTHIQQFIDLKDFELSNLQEIDELWKEAQSFEYNDLLHEAKYHYDRGFIDEAEDYLDYIWGRVIGYPNFVKTPSFQRK